MDALTAELAVEKRGRREAAMAYAAAEKRKEEWKSMAATHFTSLVQLRGEWDSCMRETEERTKKSRLGRDGAGGSSSAGGGRSDLWQNRFCRGGGGDLTECHLAGWRGVGTHFSDHEDESRAGGGRRAEGERSRQRASRAG